MSVSDQMGRRFEECGRTSCNYSINLGLNQFSGWNKKIPGRHSAV